MLISFSCSYLTVHDNWNQLTFNENLKHVESKVNGIVLKKYKKKIISLYVIKEYNWTILLKNNIRYKEQKIIITIFLGD